MTGARGGLAGVGCGVLMAVAGAWAPDAALAQQRGALVPLAGQSGNSDRIIDSIQKRFHARVVRVADTQFNGRAALELRLLSDQRVWTIVVDAQSGQVLSGG
jgi:hypothetical protein